MKMSCNWQTVQRLGFAAIILAGLNTVSAHVFNLSGRLDSGADLADAAMALLGVISLVVASCLKDFEARIKHSEER